MNIKEAYVDEKKIKAFTAKELSVLITRVTSPTGVS